MDQQKVTSRKYPQSFIFKLMTKRSAKGSLSYKVIPNSKLSHYVGKLISSVKSYMKKNENMIQ
jgi:hypothetical protein